jgi:hypothetical protein
LQHVAAAGGGFEVGVVFFDEQLVLGAGRGGEVGAVDDVLNELRELFGIAMLADVKVLEPALGVQEHEGGSSLNFQFLYGELGVAQDRHRAAPVRERPLGDVVGDAAWRVETDGVESEFFVVFELLVGLFQ